MAFTGSMTNKTTAINRAFFTKTSNRTHTIYAKKLLRVQICVWVTALPTLTSMLPLNAMRNSFFASLEKTRWNVCLNNDVLNESAITMWPLYTASRARTVDIKMLFARTCKDQILSHETNSCNDDHDITQHGFTTIHIPVVTACQALPTPKSYQRRGIASPRNTSWYAYESWPLLASHQKSKA